MPDLGNNLSQYIDLLTKMTIQYAPKVLLALATLIIGLWLINRLLSWTDKRLDGRYDRSLHKFVHSLISIGLKSLLVISAASMIGIQTTSFIAILGAAGLAVGLALQGNLSNFAGGVMILIFKPFRVGDVIEAGGYIATVKEIQIFHTVLNTADNRRVIMPNATLSNNSLVNINVEPTRRVDMKFGISYSDDIVKTKQVLQSLIDADSRILKDPAPMIALGELADSSVNFIVRAWVNTADYWGVFFDMHENVKLRFDAENISIPFPQRDVHLYQAQ